MKCLVTGGAGFIGSNLVEVLLEAGCEVVVLDNLSTGYRQNIEQFSTLEFVDGDVRDAEAVDRASRGVEVVFHLAASVGNARSIENPILDAEVNVLGTLNVLEATRKQGVRKMVFSSSAGVFGQLKTLPIREDHPAEPDSPYGASKLGAEKLCLVYDKLFDCEIVALRYFNVYGKNQRYDAYGNVIPIFAHQLLSGAPISIYDDGEQTRDFVNVKDVVAANYRAAMVRGVSGPFNIASGAAITINRLVELMCQVGDHSPIVEYLPHRDGDVRDSCADISAAQNAFEFAPAASPGEGLAEYMTWAEQAGI